MLIPARKIDCPYGRKFDHGVFCWLTSSFLHTFKADFEWMWIWRIISATVYYSSESNLLLPISKFEKILEWKTVKMCILNQPEMYFFHCVYYLNQTRYEFEISDL